VLPASLESHMSLAIHEPDRSGLASVALEIAVEIFAVQQRGVHQTEASQAYRIEILGREDV
jgi:hypothetical protein